MANVDAAIDYVLGWEDATLSGVITTAPDGKRTRFGIDEHWHPELTNCLYFSSMGQVAALQIARGIYDISYCQPLCVAEIASQEIANKLLSLGVNVGVVNAARMLQDAVTVVGDGRIGPLTLHALDLADPEKVVEDLRVEAETYYDDLIAKNPKLAVYRAGWLRESDCMSNLQIWRCSIAASAIGGAAGAIGAYIAAPLEDCPGDRID